MVKLTEDIVLPEKVKGIVDGSHGFNNSFCGDCRQADASTCSSGTRMLYQDYFFETPGLMNVFAGFTSHAQKRVGEG